ncbi:alpha/beta hydrolase [Palleronia caenipelagi]|uniref:Alpha/beta hydrolase n=1 Tax=Palleronia caenipelagi TaxID=2489174 RepID=A0A547Q7S0_9RHOB|nr:alpha/beta hydrolase [Palleronia caenipelagi]TRD22424.1 alpha/beta hydrolase [Palleronia caenipelagi]
MNTPNFAETTGMPLRGTPDTIGFAERGAETLKMDIYHTGGPARPGVLYAYGGGFVKGARENERQSALIARLLHDGWAVVVPDYRRGAPPEALAQPLLRQVRQAARQARSEGVGLARKLMGHRLFLASEDISDALRYCRLNWGALGLTGPRLAMIGVSAGGLAGNTLCHPPVPWQGRFEQPDAMVSLAAPVVHPFALRRDAPPVWVLHGQRDRILPVGDSARIAARAPEAGAPVEVQMPPDAPHIQITRYLLQRTVAPGQTYYDLMAAFLRRNGVGPDPLASEGRGFNPVRNNG